VITVTKEVNGNQKHHVAALSRTAHNVPSIFLECAECSRVNIKNSHIPGIFLEYFEKLYKAE